eukprot:COSAG02_NODE_7829_length_2831_cov_1.499268_3_plen_62_part_00
MIPTQPVTPPPSDTQGYRIVLVGLCTATRDCHMLHQKWAVLCIYLQGCSAFSAVLVIRYAL